MARNRSDSRGSSGRSSLRRSTGPSRPTHTAPSRGSSSASHPAAKPSVPAPAKPSAAAPATPAQPGQGQSVAKDIATTAAGVAIGSAVGHAISSAASGLFGGKDQHTTQSQSFLAGLDGGTQCAAEMKQFLKCALNENELQTCEAFNEALRQCVFKNNVQI